MNQLVRQSKKLFCDSLKIKVQGGTGGCGLPRYGGIGGRGGDVYLTGTLKDIKLSNLLKSPLCKGGWFKAQDGMSALRTRLVGEPGKDIVLQVPLGVSIEDQDGQKLGDINSPKNKIIIALGGRGGDKFNDSQGFAGQKRVVRLDLKMISDAAFVGFPNAGKSSLLRAISSAKPRVADYPFTTLRPHLGVVQFHDHRRITMADLPGLIEGAHKNLGLGLDFLKHIERCRILTFVVDANDADPCETVRILKQEIELYDDAILTKPAILALNKIDLVDTRYCKKLCTQLKESSCLKFEDVIPLSAKMGLNIDNLKKAARKTIDDQEERARAERDEAGSFKDFERLDHNKLMDSF